MNKKLKFLIVIFVSVVIGYLILRFLTYSVINKPRNSTYTASDLSETPSETQSVNIILDFGSGETFAYQAQQKEGQNAFTLLQELAQENNVALETEQYDFGVFVKSINGHESSAEKAWIYFVNGKSGQIAADKYELKGGDHIEWKYITPKEE